MAGSRAAEPDAKTAQGSRPSSRPRPAPEVTSREGVPGGRGSLGRPLSAIPETSGAARGEPEVRGVADPRPRPRGAAQVTLERGPKWLFWTGLCRKWWFLGLHLVADTALSGRGSRRGSSQTSLGGVAVPRARPIPQTLSQAQGPALGLSNRDGHPRVLSACTRQALSLVQ